VIDAKKYKFDIHRSLPFRPAEQGCGVSGAKILPTLYIPVPLVFKSIR
jgi:hypothetical protein